MDQYMKNVTIKWGFSFWFQCYSKSGCLYEFDMYLGKMVKIEFSLVESLPFREPKKVFWQPFYECETDFEALGKQDLWNWNSQSKSKIYALFKSR